MHYIVPGIICVKITQFVNNSLTQTLTVTKSKRTDIYFTQSNQTVSCEADKGR